MFMHFNMKNMLATGQRIKTWKRRYVVVELGYESAGLLLLFNKVIVYFCRRLSYFEKSNGTSEPPYGLNQKGL